jgi:hypothetical protein
MRLRGSCGPAPGEYYYFTIISTRREAFVASRTTGYGRRSLPHALLREAFVASRTTGYGRRSLPHALRANSISQMRFSFATKESESEVAPGLCLIDAYRKLWIVLWITPVAGCPVAVRNW